MPLFGAIGARIGYEVYPHPRGAPPVLLIHGLTASSASFVSNLADLQRDFTVVTVDLLGHGQSDASPLTDDYGPGPACERIAALLDLLGHARVLVCGHSLGGAVALRFALDHPGRVAGLIVINSNSAAMAPEAREEMQPRMAAMAERLLAEGTGFLKRTRLYPAASRRLPEEARRLLEEDFDRITPAAAAGTFAGLVANVNAFERLSALEPPILVVIGDRDTEFVKNAPPMLARLPAERLTVVTLEGAGHAANLEQPAAFHRALTTFAREIGYLGRPSAPSPGLGSRLSVVAGAGFMVASLALLGGAVAMRLNRDGPPAPLAAAAVVSGIASPSPATARTAPPPLPRTAVPPGSATPATPAAAATPGPSPVPRAAATEVQQVLVVVTEGPIDPATPVAEEPGPSATPPPAPATPRLAIQGPATAGLSAGFGAAPTPWDYLSIRWSVSGGAVAAPAAGSITTVTFPAPGCYTVTATALFPDGTSASASQAVAAGGVAC
ncbi:MAG: alpha/beta fold hydrolase [Dehalococcoidia bacterium]